jgi:thioredoxin 1
VNNFIILIVGIVAIFLILRTILWFRSWSKRGKPAPKVGGRLGNLINRGEDVIAYFYSPTCSACKVQDKNLSRVQDKFSNIVKINVAKENDMAKEFSVMGTPTTVLIKNNKIFEYFVGVTPAKKILNALNVN